MSPWNATGGRIVEIVSLSTWENFISDPIAPRLLSGSSSTFGRRKEQLQNLNYSTEKECLCQDLFQKGIKKIVRKEEM